MQKALEQMNVKLTEVASDITGVTGSRIIEAILRGERDAQKLAALRDARCANTEEEYAKALAGTWRPEHLFALKQAFELYSSSTVRLRPAMSRSTPSWPGCPTVPATNPSRRGFGGVATKATTYASTPLSPCSRLWVWT